MSDRQTLDTMLDDGDKGAQNGHSGGLMELILSNVLKIVKQMKVRSTRSTRERSGAVRDVGVRFGLGVEEAAFGSSLRETALVPHLKHWLPSPLIPSPP